MIIYTILAAILITVTEEKIINITLVLLINFIYLAIIYGFSASNSIYETVYQIGSDNQGYQIKLYRYILILISFLWLTFFLLALFFMLADKIAYNTWVDYLAIIKKDWWKLLIISIYHVALIVIHRQILWYKIHY